MEETVNPENVCKFIEIAFANNFEALKTRSLKVLNENRNFISAEALNALPKEILLQAYLSQTI